jgi:hypothetical protein
MTARASARVVDSVETVRAFERVIFVETDFTVTEISAGEEVDRPDVERHRRQSDSSQGDTDQDRGHVRS